MSDPLTSTTPSARICAPARASLPELFAPITAGLAAGYMGIPEAALVHALEDGAFGGTCEAGRWMVDPFALAGFTPADSDDDDDPPSAFQRYFSDHDRLSAGADHQPKEDE